MSPCCNTMILIVLLYKNIMLTKQTPDNFLSRASKRDFAARRLTAQLHRRFYAGALRQRPQALAEAAIVLNREQANELLKRKSLTSACR